MNKHNIIIPAAGSARRLRPLTDSLPKSLLKINNKPIIEHQLLNLPEEHIKRVIIILGYKGDKIKNHIGSLALNYPVKYYYNENYENTNCSYSLMKAKHEISKGFIIINCDLLFKKDRVKQFLNSDYPSAVFVRKNDNYKTDLQDVLIYSNKIIEWSLKLNDANAEVMGPLKMCADDAEKVIKYFDSLKKTEKEKIHCFSLFSDCVDKIDFHPVYVHDTDWLEIDTPEDLDNARKSGFFIK